MYCTKCGNQLEERVEICNGCGCATQFYGRSETKITRNKEYAFKLMILPLYSVLFPLLGGAGRYVIYVLRHNISYTALSFYSLLSNISWIASHMAIIVFCIVNMKSSSLSKIAKVSLIIIAISRFFIIIYIFLYKSGFSLYEVSINSLLQYGIIEVLFFGSIAILLISLKKTLALSGLQNTFRISGIIVSFLYVFWHLFIQIPNQISSLSQSKSIALGDFLYEILSNWYYHFGIYLTPVLKNYGIIYYLGATFYLSLLVVFYITEPMKLSAIEEN